MYGDMNGGKSHIRIRCGRHRKADATSLRAPNHPRRLGDNACAHRRSKPRSMENPSQEIQSDKAQGQVLGAQERHIRLDEEVVLGARRRKDNLSTPAEVNRAWLQDPESSR